MYVDIFILDNAKEYAGIRAKIAGSLGRFLQIAKLSPFEKEFLYKRFSKNKLKMLVIGLGELLRRIFGSTKIEKWNYSLLVTQKKSDSLIIIEMPQAPMPKSCFSEAVLKPFEDGEFLVPCEYDQLLKIWYGDYMEIPPEGKKFLEEEN